MLPSTRSLVLALLLGPLAAAGCGRTERSIADLPEGWEEAAPLLVDQQASCTEGGKPEEKNESVEVSVWSSPARVTYHKAIFCRGQQLCGFRVDSGTTARVLIQPCEMNPVAVAPCECEVEASVLLVTQAPLTAVEVWRRWDNTIVASQTRGGFAPPNNPKRIASVQRPSGAR